MPDKIKAVAPDAPLDSWDLLFKPENAKRIAACGITMMDSAIDVIPSVLKFLGRDPGQQRAGRSRRGRADVDGDPSLYPLFRQRRRAGGAWRPVRPASRSIIPATYAGGVARGRGEARASPSRYIAPKEGVEVGFDMLAIPADAPHKDAALAFINFVLRPAVMARHHRCHALSERGAGQPSR